MPVSWFSGGILLLLVAVSQLNNLWQNSIVVVVYITLTVDCSVLLSPGLLPAAASLTYLQVTFTCVSSPDTGSMTHDIKTRDLDAMQPVESEPQATVSTKLSLSLMFPLNF